MASILFKIVRICNSQFKYNYVKKEKIFLNFLHHIWNLLQILNIFKEKMIVIANVFAKLDTVKNFVRRLSKKPRYFYHVFSSSFSMKLIWKMSPVVFGEILEVFVNTLIAADKYLV